jgi:hypothetical protein
MFGRKLDTLLGLATVNARLGEVTFDLVIKFVDSDRDDSTCSFLSAAEREAHADALIAQPSKAKEIASINYDDTLVFWRCGRNGDALPLQAPDLDGAGELLVKITGSNNSTFEATGYGMKEIKRSYGTHKTTFGDPLEASVIRRVVAYERISVLVKVGSAPASALSFDNQTSEWA